MGSKIVALDIEHVKRITAAHIEPDGSLVIIGGRNAQGKSSVLDSIAYALGGKKMIPSEPLRRGEDKGRVSVTLDDGVTITRTFTAAGGGTLKIETADGMSPAGAQGWLDDRIGTLSFDPTAFLRDKDQAATLRRLCGVDTTDLDADRKRLYAERTEVGRDRDRAKGAADSAPHYSDAPADEVSVAALMERRNKAVAEIEAHRESIAGATAQADRAERLRGEADDDSATADDLEERARALRDKATERLALADLAEREAGEAMRQAEAMAGGLPDLSTIDTEISGAGEINARVRDNARHAELVAEADALADAYDAKTTEIRSLDEQRAKMLADAQMPVEGLGIDENGAVTFGDLPLDQASQAEQIRISLGVGVALSPDLRIILIRDGSLLDQDNLRLISDLADEQGAQVWIERVGNADEHAVVIEDGTVADEED